MHKCHLETGKCHCVKQLHKRHDQISIQQNKKKIKQLLSKIDFASPSLLLPIHKSFNRSHALISFDYNQFNHICMDINFTVIHRWFFKNKIFVCFCWLLPQKKNNIGFYALYAALFLLSFCFDPTNNFLFFSVVIFGLAISCLALNARFPLFSNKFDSNGGIFFSIAHTYSLSL